MATFSSHWFLFISFVAGLFLSMLNKADDRAKGRDPLVFNWRQYFVAYWIPLLTRSAIETAFFLLTFNAEVVAKLLNAMHWDSFAWIASMIVQFAPVAFLFGLSMDPIAEKMLSKFGALLPINFPVIPAPHEVDPK